jgi:hypothetical protein
VDKVKEDCQLTNDEAEEGVNELHKNFGMLTGRATLGLQTRASFLNGKPPYHLYYWEVMDRHQLLSSSLQRLSNSIGLADASQTPLTTPLAFIRRPRHSTESESGGSSEKATASFISQSLNALTDIQVRLVGLVEGRDIDIFVTRKHQLEDEARKYRRLLAELQEAEPKKPKLEAFYNNEAARIEEEMEEVDRQIRIT